MASIQEVHALFPAQLLEQMWLEPVNEDTLDEVLARSLAAFSPVFLPVFEKGGDMYAIHLQPEMRWQESPWVRLPHDAAEPSLVATRLQYLPGGLAVYWFASRLEEIWDSLQLLANSLPGAVMPSKELLSDPYAEIAFLKSQLDPLDGAAKIANAVRRPTPEEQYAERVEAIYQQLPDDTLTLAAVAIVRAKFGHADPVMPALQVMRRELLTGFKYVNRLIIADSGPELLELMRPIAEPGIDAASPLAPLKNISLKDLKAAAAFSEVADRLSALGEEKQALAQLRNGAALTAMYGKLDAGWCDRLADQTERVEAGSLSASVARLAAQVIHLGP